MTATNANDALNGFGTTAAQYIKITLSPASGYAADITSLAFNGTSQGRTRTFDLRYVNPSNGTVIAVGSQEVSGGVYTFPVTGITNLTQALELRMYIYSATVNEYEAAGFGEASGLDLVINGNVYSATTPSSNNPNVLAETLTLTGNRITYTGSQLEFYTPVQGQYNGNKPVLSMSQYGEMSFYSSPYLNYNNIYLKGTGDYSNGLSYADNFGTVNNIGGPVLFGATGGALGTRPSWDNAQGKAALSWDANKNVTVHGNLTSHSLTFADGTVQTTAGFSPTIVNNYITYPQKVNIPEEIKIGTNSLYLGSNTTGQAGINNYIYSDGGALEIQNQTTGFENTILNKNGGSVQIGNIPTASNIAKLNVNNSINVTGMFPFAKIGTLVIQDFSYISNDVVFSGSYTDPNTGQTYTYNVTAPTDVPQAYVFGNVYYDASSNMYKRVMPPGSYQHLGGGAIKFDGDGSLSLLNVPFNAFNAPVQGIVGEDISKHVNLYSGSNGRVGIGTVTPDRKLTVAGDMAVQGKFYLSSTTSDIILQDGSKLQRMWKTKDRGTNNAPIVFYNENAPIGIGSDSPALDTKLDVAGIIKSTGLRIATNAGQNKVLTSDANGNASWQTQPWYLSNVNYITTDNKVILLSGSTNPALPSLVVNGLSSFDDINTGSINAVGNIQASGGIKATSIQLGTGPVITDFGQLNTWIPITDGISYTGKVKIDGTLAAKEVCVNETASWCDYVFENEYKLRDIKDLELFLKKNKHLPDVPSEKEVKANGYNLTNMDAILLKKIEELTLYVIKQEKEIQSLKKNLAKK
jgi:hypothetical protein